MQFIKDSSPGTQLITGIDKHAVRINEQIYSGSLILHPEQVLPNWPVTHTGELNDRTIGLVLETEPELIILGTGTELIFPETPQLRRAYERGIGVEVMDTEAACRTYNILAIEGRKVTAALIFANA